MATATDRPQKTGSMSERLTRGVLGGFLAGVAFIAITSWFATTNGSPALAPFKLIASLAQAEPVMDNTIWYGMAIHAVLSAILGVVFVVLTQAVHSQNAVLALSGLLYGGIVYAVNFQVFARFVPQFNPLTTTNQPFELAVHLVFGALLALFVMHWPRSKSA